MGYDTLRFIIEGANAYTAVGGERTTMHCPGGQPISASGRAPAPDWRACSLAAVPASVTDKAERSKQAWAAFAAGYSGGSMVEGHAVPCPPDLTAKMARIAVLTALGRLTGREHQTALRNCVEACIRLADDDGKTS